MCIAQIAPTSYAGARVVRTVRDSVTACLAHVGFTYIIRHTNVGCARRWRLLRCPRMCGIGGLVHSEPSSPADRHAVTRALTAIAHRGPDGAGTLLAPGFSGGMRRLAIIDVAGGDQPIFDESGQIGVLFNGEIYNYRELRAEAESRGHTFRTRTDTEVLVHLYEDFGPDFLPRLDGMFALAIWDAPRRRCLLARDRFGIKPLHLARTPNGLAFASEIKSLVAAGWLEPAIDTTTAGDYVRLGWVPDHRSMWRGVERLAPGHYVVVERGLPQDPVRYHRHRIGGAPVRSREDTDATTVSLVEAAVRRQLVADVPVGIFLSGGLDSSLIAAAASRVTRDLPCHTIQIRSEDGAGDPTDDDAPHAKRVAQHFGLPLHVHTIEPNAIELLPKLLRALDEPSGDPAIMLSFLIADAARPTTKVLLSGMGADEIVGGYRRHLAARWSRIFYRLPSQAREHAGRTARSLASLLGVVPVSSRPLLRRAQKALGRLPSDVRALPEAFASWLPLGLSPSLTSGPPTPLWPRIADAVELAGPVAPLEACLAFDVAVYLPSHNLFYVDKTTMAASVEVRVPFLDNALSEHLMALPPGEKVAGTTTKLALRRAAERLVPREIIHRPKTGFGAPIRTWLRGELRPMMMDLLAPSVVRSRGLFDPDGVQHLLDIFERDSDDVSYPLWHLLMLELWCCEVMDRPHGCAESEAGATRSVGVRAAG